MLTLLHRTAAWPRSRQLAVALVCCLFFGVCLGGHGLSAPDGHAAEQILSSALKVPLIIFASCALAFLVCAAVSRPLLGVRARPVFHAGRWALLATSVCLAVLGLFVLLVLQTNNYSLVILSAYACFGLSGLVGSLAFWFELKLSIGAATRRHIGVAAGLFLLCLGLAEAQIGWSLRPLVGWTGQSFTFVRRDKATLFDQLRCEVRNTINFGGIRFPGKNEASDTKAWPC